VRAEQIEKLERLRAERDSAEVERALGRIDPGRGSGRGLAWRTNLLALAINAAGPIGEPSGKISDAAGEGLRAATRPRSVRSPVCIATRPGR